MFIQISSAAWPGSGIEAFQFLKKMCLNRLAKRFSVPGEGMVVSPAILGQLERELLQFHQAGILPAIAQLGQWVEILEKEGAAVTTLGAACSSLVLFGTGLMPFCPTDYGLVFERIRLEGLATDGEWAFSVLVDGRGLELFRAFPQGRACGMGKRIRLQVSEKRRLGHLMVWRQLEPSLRPPSSQVIQEALDLLAQGKTGCNAGEGNGDLLALLQQAKPQSLEEWALCQSLDHPTRRGMGWPGIYLQRKAAAACGSQPMTREGVMLAGTFGLPIYQEDLMRILHEILGMEWGQAYRFVLALSTGLERRVGPAVEDYFQKAAKAGVAEMRAKGILCLMEYGAPRATCKANAIAQGYLMVGEVLGRKS